MQVRTNYSERHMRDLDIYHFGPRFHPVTSRCFYICWRNTVWPEWLNRWAESRIALCQQLLARGETQAGPTTYCKAGVRAGPGSDAQYIQVIQLRNIRCALPALSDHWLTGESTRLRDPSLPEKVKEGIPFLLCCPHGQRFSLTLFENVKPLVYTEESRVGRWLRG